MTGKLTLTDLQLIIRDSLYLALPDFYWVIAEISEIKQNYSGHCYLELIEKQSDETSVKARIKAVIWSNRYNFIKSFFESTTGESLREGFKILVKARVEYHELYGLSLVITDIDPAFTIGEMAAKRMMVIKRLENEGVFTMNKELKLPIVPQRIAIISSANAAGYTDFIRHLKGNNSGYVFYTSLFEAVMQGTGTEQSIIDALDKVAVNSCWLDLVVIIRGGGSQTDLSWFDSYNIAYHVTQFPLPVITGIGHEKDLSVTDMVACRSLKTPTAVADFIIECITETENHIYEVSSGIRIISQTILGKSKNRLERSKNTFSPITRIMISDMRKKLSDKLLELLNFGKVNTLKAEVLLADRKSRLTSASKSYADKKESLIRNFRSDIIIKTIESIKSREQKLFAMDNTLNILKPENVLKRGYTITSVNGRILKSVVQADEGDVIDTDFSDGRITSKILNSTI